LCVFFWIPRAMCRGGFSLALALAGTRTPTKGSRDDIDEEAPHFLSRFRFRPPKFNRVIFVSDTSFHFFILFIIIFISLEFFTLLLFESIKQSIRLSTMIHHLYLPFYVEIFYREN
jgi:hypothetical protein